MTVRRFSLVGPGRAGMSLRTALIDVGWECAAVFGRGDDHSDAANDVDACIIATADADITDVAASIEPTNAIVMHLSGATPLAVLDHPRTAALHPLQSLPEPEVGAASLRQCYYAVAGDDIAQQMAEELSGKWFSIDDADRAIYHCAAVIASNHTVALLGQVERLATSIGVPFEAFESIVSTSIANTWASGPAAALTGPASRGDQVTIDAHRAALIERHADELESYDAAVELARRLAGRLGE